MPTDRGGQFPLQADVTDGLISPRTRGTGKEGQGFKPCRGKLRGERLQPRMAGLLEKAECRGPEPEYTDAEYEGRDDYFYESERPEVEPAQQTATRAAPGIES